VKEFWASKPCIHVNSVSLVAYLLTESIDNTMFFVIGVCVSILFVCCAHSHLLPHRTEHFLVPFMYT